MAAAPKPVYLAPGEYFVGDARHRVRTLLGSCVSITLWQPHRRIGAMSHFLLAERSPLPGGAAAGSAGPVLDARYGGEALTLMLRKLAALGVAPAECEAKLFGGGDMFPLQTRGRSQHVGRRNGDGAKALLQAHGIRIASHSLFGVGHRKIMFDIATGHVWAWHEEADSDVAPLDVLAPAGIAKADAQLRRADS